MTENELLLAMLEMAREKSLDTLEKIAKMPNPAAVLSWRPGPGRAHIGWQFMHIGVTEDRYLHMRILNKPPAQPELCERYGGGSTPADVPPTLAEIRETMTANRARLAEYVRGLSPTVLDTKPFPDAPRTHRQSLLLLAWHEGHHQGQAHITLNMYNAAHGTK